MNIFDGLENKTVLITGATGFIGFRMITLLLDRTTNCEIVAVGRSQKKLEATFASISDKRIKLISQEAKSSLPLNCDFAVDYLFHAGGPQERDIVINKPLEVINANIQGLIDCAEFLLKQENKHHKKGRLVVFSSLTIYALSDNKTLRVVTESDTNTAGAVSNPTTVYSDAKRMSELIASAYHRTFELDYVTCRISTVYGPSHAPSNTAFFEFIANAKTLTDIKVNERYGMQRDNIFIDDAVLGILCAAVKGKTGEAYNVSSSGDLGHFCSVGEIANLIAEVANRQINADQRICVEYKTESGPDQTYGVKLCNKKLKSLGWKMYTQHIDGIRLSLGLPRK